MANAMPSDSYLLLFFTRAANTYTSDEVGLQIAFDFRFIESQNAKHQHKTGGKTHLSRNELYRNSYTNEWTDGCLYLGDYFRWCNELVPCMLLHCTISFELFILIRWSLRLWTFADFNPRKTYFILIFWSVVEMSHRNKRYTHGRKAVWKWLNRDMSYS